MPVTQQSRVQAQSTASSSALSRENQDVSITVSNSVPVEEKNWIISLHESAEETGMSNQSFYNVLMHQSNSSSDSLNDISYAATPRRTTIPFVETNASGAKREVFVKYRPLRQWMDTKGAQGVALKALSYLQTAGHWGLAVGPYTYDIYQDEQRQVVFHKGQWNLENPNARARVKSKAIGHTFLRDTTILEIAEQIYNVMRPDRYDEKFNNCHRFVSSLADRIATRDNDKPAKLQLRLLYTWYLIPASHFFMAAEYSMSFLRIPKRVLFENALGELLDSESRSEIWQVIKKHSKVASIAIVFLLTVGPMSVFLAMARSITRWDPDDPKGRELYLKLFDNCLIPEDLATNYLNCAFKGPQGLRLIVEKLIQLPDSGRMSYLRGSA